MTTPNDRRRTTGPRKPVSPGEGFKRPGRTTGPRDQIEPRSPAATGPSANAANAASAGHPSNADSGLSPAAGSGVGSAVPGLDRSPRPVAPAAGNPAGLAAPADAAPPRRGTNRQPQVTKTARRRPIGSNGLPVEKAVRPMSRNTKILLGVFAGTCVLVMALFLSMVLHAPGADAVHPHPAGSTATTGQPPATGPAGTATDPHAATASGTGTQPPSAEPLTDRQKMVVDYDNYARDHAGDILGRREKLDQLMTVYDDDDWVSCVTARIDKLKATADRVAQERVATVIQKSNACAEKDDYAGAFEALDSFPEQLSRTDAAFKLNFQRRKIGEMAQGSVKNAEVRAQKAMDAGKFDEALDAYKGLLASKYPPIMQDVRIRMNEIKDAKTLGLHPGDDPAPEFSGMRRFYSADAYAGVKAATTVYDDQVQEAVHGFMSNVDGVKSELETYPRSAVLYYCLCLLEARSGDRPQAEWALTQARRLVGSNPAFESRALSAEARMFMVELKLDEAQDKCAAALKADAGNPEALFVKGLCQYIEYAQLRAMPGAREAAQALMTDMIRSFKAAVALDAAYARVLPPRLRGESEEAETTETAETGDANDPYRYKGNGGNPYLAAVVVIHRETEYGTALGTGWVVASKEGVAYVITNHHVVGNGKTFKVKYRVPTIDSVSVKETGDVKVLGVDTVYDLALLEVKTVNTIKPLPLQGTVSGLKCPQEVTVIGHPKGLEFTVITARLSNLNRIVEKNRMLQFDGDADHGMSGGPIIDSDGNVIGVVQGGYDEIKGQCLGVISEHVSDICKKCSVAVDVKKAP